MLKYVFQKSKPKSEAYYDVHKLEKILSTKS